MRTVLMLAAVLFLVACGSDDNNAPPGSPPFPGNGPLVIVHIDAIFDQSVWCGTTKGALIREGLHYWDQVGATFRAPDEVSTGAPAVAELTARQVDFMNPRTGGDFDGAHINITSDLSAETGPHCAEYLRTITAHEIGHAMGLQHVPDDAVMYYVATPQTALTAADVREWERVWAH